MSTERTYVLALLAIVLVGGSLAGVILLWRRAPTASIALAGFLTAGVGAFLIYYGAYGPRHAQVAVAFFASAGLLLSGALATLFVHSRTEDPAIPATGRDLHIGDSTVRDRGRRLGDRLRMPPIQGVVGEWVLLLRRRRGRPWGVADCDRRSRLHRLRGLGGRVLGRLVGGDRVVTFALYHFQSPAPSYPVRRLRG